MSYLQSLSVFFAVVEEGSFSAAAKKLTLTQPTISFHIDNLEKRLGCPLFIRTAKGVNLTVYGQLLHDNTHTFNAILGETENQIKAMVAGSSGLITIGASTIPGEYILPPLLAKFRQQSPGVRLAIKTGDSSSIMKQFHNGELPIAIVGFQPDASIPSIPMWNDELVLVGHPDVCRRLPASPSITQLITQPFVLRDDTSGSSRTWFQAMERQGLRPSELHAVLKVGGNEALKAAIIQQIGIGFISRWAIQQELKDGRLQIIPVPDLSVQRRFYAIHATPLAPTCIELFWHFLLNHQDD